MRDESAGQRADRHEAPAEHAVDAVDQAEQVRGHDLLARAAMFATRKTIAIATAATTAACTAWARHMSVARS